MCQSNLALIHFFSGIKSPQLYNGQDHSGSFVRLLRIESLLSGRILASTAVTTKTPTQLEIRWLFSSKMVD